MSCNQRKRACPEREAMNVNRNNSHYVPRMINLGPRSVSNSVSATTDKRSQRVRKFEEKVNPCTNFKTKICYRFVQGKCTYGDRCRFAHGQAELRSCNKVVLDEDDGYSRRKRSWQKVKRCYKNHVVDAYNIVHDSNLSRCTRVSVEGYDTSRLPVDDIKSALFKRFFTCGEIFDVVIPSKSNLGFIYFLEESGKEKALALSGSDMGGGWNVVVKALKNKVCEFSRDEVNAAQDVLHTEETRHSAFLVTGYDTSLPVDDIESALFKLFSSCGEITHLSVYKGDRSGCISIWGPEALEKVMKLSGSDVGGWNVIVMPLVIPQSSEIGLLGPIVGYDDGAPDHFKYPKKIKTTEITA